MFNFKQSGYMKVHCWREHWCMGISTTLDGCVHILPWAAPSLDAWPDMVPVVLPVQQLFHHWGLLASGHTWWQWRRGQRECFPYLILRSVIVFLALSSFPLNILGSPWSTNTRWGTVHRLTWGQQMSETAGNTSGSIPLRNCWSTGSGGPCAVCIAGKSGNGEHEEVCTSRIEHTLSSHHSFLHQHACQRNPACFEAVEQSLGHWRQLEHVPWVSWTPVCWRAGHVEHPISCLTSSVWQPSGLWHNRRKISLCKWEKGR